MGKAEKGTPKAIANGMKAKGLGKLKWYCQVCEKQCRDDNGFKQHTMSEGHLRAMITVGDSAGKTISGYSEQFQSDFLTLLSRRWGTKRVRANQVYQEFIQDKSHLHMNATKWVTLTEFVKHLGRSGIVHADDTEKGWFISWIDTSPKALARQAASQAKERADMDDEQRERKILAEQIKRAQEMAAAQSGVPRPSESGAGPAASGSGAGAGTGTEEQEPPKPVTMMPISLSLGKSKAAAAEEKKESPPADEKNPQPEASSSSATPAPPSGGISLGGGGLKMNPLKKPSTGGGGGNALKAASTAAKDKEKEKSKSGGATHSMSAAEQLMSEDLQRKKRVAERQERDERDRKRARQD